MKSKMVTLALAVSTFSAAMFFNCLGINADTGSAVQPPQGGVVREKNAEAPRLTLEQVSGIASACIGQSQAQVASAGSILITDHSNPLADMNRRPVWEVVVDKIDISVGAGQQKKHNPNISRLSVLVDDQTGAVLQISSPKPRTDGLAAISGSYVRTTDAGETLRPAPVVPHLSFVAALQAIDRTMPGLATDAREIVGYYALATDNDDPKTGMKDRPCWIILYGGIKRAHPSAGPPSRKRRENIYATEAFAEVDANTGKFQFIEFVGGSVDN